MLVALETLVGPFPQAKPLARRLIEAVPEVGGVVRIPVGPRGQARNAEVLAGQGTLREEIDGLSLTVTAGAFLQVNPAQARSLYRRVLEMAHVGSHDRALDLYCGAGAITMLLGRTARDATGVESSSESVGCAERNARDNGLARCRFVHGEAAHVTRGLAARGSGYEVVVVNPPRAGLEKEVIESVASLSPSRLIYVSCDPATLARDLARFARLGYRTTDVAPFDMFPHSYHVETVVRLEGKAPAHGEIGKGRRSKFGAVLPGARL
jgi:23S rRNA (uracil1939-C5)-methyltransferase